MLKFLSILVWTITESTQRTDTAEQLALFTPDDLQRAEESGEFDLDANLLNLRPDPTHFVAFIKSLDRSDVVSELFVRLLEAYRQSKAARDVDPLRFVFTRAANECPD